MKELNLDSINYLAWESKFSIRPPRFFYISQWEILGWKTAYVMILANNTKWVSSKLFVYGMAKLGPLGMRHLYQLFIIELLLVSRVGYMDPHITDWLTKPSQEPRTGNQLICQVVCISTLRLQTLLTLPRV